MLFDTDEGKLPFQPTIRFLTTRGSVEAVNTTSWKFGGSKTVFCCKSLEMRDKLSPLAIFSSRLSKMFSTS